MYEDSFGGLWASSYSFCPRVSSESSVFLLCEEVSVAHVLIWVVTGHGVWGHLLIGISEVDVSHVICVMKEIWVESIVVPEVMLVILTEVSAWEPVSLNHVAKASEESESDVSPEDGSHEVEPRVNWSHDLIVWMG